MIDSYQLRLGCSGYMAPLNCEINLQKCYLNYLITKIVQINKGKVLKFSVHSATAWSASAFLRSVGFTGHDQAPRRGHLVSRGC